jgi:NitT/TauT family transport system permease protein
MLSDLVISSAFSFYRMMIAYIASLIASLLLGVSMARSRLVETVMLPVLDILQSIPILSFFPAVLILFISTLGPGIGGELSAIMLIATSMVWNMIFGVYTSVKSLDPSIDLMSKVYHYPRAIRFFKIYLPASVSGLLSNTIISWAGGWFFLVSSEVISLGSVQYRLRGLGCFIFEAYAKGDDGAAFLGLVTMFAIILLSYVIIWNPLMNEHVIPGLFVGVMKVYSLIEKMFMRAWRLIESIFIYGSFQTSLITFTIPLFLNVHPSTGLTSILGRYGGLFLENLPKTFLRVYVALLIDFTLTIPLVYVYHRDRRAVKTLILAGEILSSIPAPLWWPILSFLALQAPLAVMYLIYLMGSLWYVYFNVVIFGLTYLKKEILELSEVYGVKGWLYMKSVFFPSILPSLLAGLLSASGGAWNASIAAEYVTIGLLSIDMGGLGSLLNKLTINGDSVGVLVVSLYMSVLIVIVNQLLWRRLYRKVAGRFVVE